MRRLSILAASLILSFLAANSYAITNNAGNSQRSNDQMSESTLAQKNLQQSEAFLAKNKKQPGVVTLPDGLQYKIIKEGTGSKPSKNDEVTVNYEGRLINGDVFDSSYQRGQPISFPISGVILGWQQALQLMHTGATWEVYIPSKLAYGEHGAPGAIGPNEALIFKIELISIKGQS